ncbi:MAG: endonuclease III [Patescibacteria group bacterium]|nr:endonuclease III [Patescibacteria group bacterium]MDD4304535.1 endonuclease III [Patescibacteria group bacterium]MDD4695643.1 endonuclease III [Patescibacteria group bacterium]
MKRILKILEKFVSQYDLPYADYIKKQTNDPFKILLSVILSSRTKDETTAKVCNNLFQHVKNIEDLKNISDKNLEKLLYPVGFYKTKTRHLKLLANILEKQYKYKIPSEIDELLKLPGVGRKTANLVVNIAFDKPGICVDVHVHRILNRLGHLKTKNPFETEIYLRQNLNKKYWRKINYILVLFGQNLCKPINPKCGVCPIYKYCKRVNVITKHEIR